MTTGNRPQTIQEMAGLLGRYRYVELTFFAITGRAVLRSKSPAMAVQLSAVSHAHAYRAELIERRLLVSDGLDHVSESTKSPGEEHDALLDSLEELSAEELAAVLALAWYPAMLAAYRERRVLCNPASDGPIGLMLSRMIFDLGSSVASLSGAFESSQFASVAATARVGLEGVGGPFGTPSF